ncbi:FTR1 family iron permease [Streptococcus macacae]|uniref:FTR1 family protein n=1 Tax=Streptococcus macacae NCTC 11558 TaxID=764298 RepID=G5JVH6_9STRE|nr:FTR1 family protein [Streptococcus macacae]EHJ52544.1 FTR1 family protein [Streptococcus macacae NCTC 11558]SUN78571.1 FTR1 family iron permease [Streptococcus macacae NCTC 11558]
MVKNYLNKSLFLLFLFLGLFIANPVKADTYSQLFIKITDAQTAVEQNDQTKAHKILKEAEQEFSVQKNADSKAGKKVTKELKELAASHKVTSKALKGLSEKLVAFEKEQNPVDTKAEKKKFKEKVYPALAKLERVIRTGNVEAMKREYLKYNSVWTRNEAIVRNTEGGHYGTIETAMSFLRASMEVQPVKQKTILSHLKEVRVALDQFMTGKKANQTSEIKSLNQGIKVLEEAYDAFSDGDTAKGEQKMKLFITNWTTFEGEVSTRSSALYTKVESQTPIIMARGHDKKYQKELKNLISELKAVLNSGSYSFIDAMLILLREGVEALLIVLALIGTLKASKQKRGLKWVYLGAALGVLASVVTAIMLQFLFPALTSGNNREMLEGAVGIFAVFMMIGVGVWLHSKANISAWQNYMEKQLNLVMSTGSFVSMFALSFLAVFREGAETILFYVGILPNISLQNLLLGILAAVLILMMLAFVFIKSSEKIPIHRVFQLLTWTIYILAFKMLGVSIHALQLTNALPTHVSPAIATVDWLGIYPTIETLTAQVIFVVIIIAIHFYQKRQENNG